MASALKILKAMLKRDEPADLERHIAALKAEASEASAEIERLNQERRFAASYDEARAIDDRMARQIWITEHAAALLPELELRLAAARAADQAAALARHKDALLELYPRLKAAILAAVDVQEAVIAARQTAIRELGEGVVTARLPQILFAGYLSRDLVVDIWQRENDLVIGELARQPQQRAARPAIAPPPPRAKSKTTAPAAHTPPTRRPARPLRADPPPTDGQAQIQIVFLKNGVDVGDGVQSIIGDRINLPADQARALVASGCADYAPTAAASRAGPALADYVVEVAQ
jgi:hypothetical protein